MINDRSSETRCPRKALRSLMAGVLLPLSLGACAWFEGDSLVGGPAGSLEPPTDYLIGPEDVVVISVWKEEGLDRPA